MTRKLPDTAFNTYVDMGVDRSYRRVAQRYGVSKQAVLNRAKREGWQDRLRELERQSREKGEEKAVEEMQAARDRQLQAARLLQARALEALRTLPPAEALKATAALNAGWKHEMELLGEPGEDSFSSADLEAIFDTWLRVLKENLNDFTLRRVIQPLRQAMDDRGSKRS